MTKQKSSTVERNVTGHGYFTASAFWYERVLQRTRASLVNSLVGIYAGCERYGDKGNRASHWRSYTKADLALIVASCEHDQAVEEEAKALAASEQRPLAGIDELRDAVAWANAEPEYRHDYKTAEQILAVYRCRRFDDGGTPAVAGDGSYVCPGCGKAAIEVARNGHEEER